MIITAGATTWTGTFQAPAAPPLPIPLGLLDYPYIRAWGERSGSHHRAIDAAIEWARESGAPADATFYSQGRWHTLSECRNRHTRAYIRAWVGRFGLPAPTWDD